MELPKNITQIGIPDPNCKVYVEDYVISYIKQLNRHAGDKEMAVALYGSRKEEAGITYLFLYGACRLNFLQRESRHLSQAVQQEAEQQRRRYFSQYAFLGYRLLNGDMVEGFHICEQNVCRYIAGYAQFYEKNDTMLAFMLEDRKEEAKPEEVNQEKYDEVKKRQEERRIQSEEQSAQAGLRRRRSETDAKAPARNPNQAMRNMKFAAAAVFVLLCLAGVATLNDGSQPGEWQMAAGRLFQSATEQQLPDREDDAGGSNQAGTIVAEDKLADAILQENMTDVSEEVRAAAGNAERETASPAPTATASPTPEASQEPVPTPSAEPADSPTPESAATPAPESAAGPTQEPAAAPVSYTIKRGDTLIGICIAKYGSDKKVAEICSFNGITDPDDIKVGQKILLP